MFERPYQENIRLKIISFCENYLKDYPSPVHSHDQHDYVSECLNALHKIKPPFSVYQLAYLLALMNEKVIAFDKGKLQFRFFENWPLGSFRLALENSIRGLVGLPSYENSINHHRGIRILPSNATRDFVAKKTDQLEMTTYSQQGKNQLQRTIS